MIAVIILYIIFGMIQIYKGEAGFQTMIYIGIGILGVLIMIFLSGTVNQIMCG
jgi:multisubunit Na+/H+ antiporter MnhB subunit